MALHCTECGFVNGEGANYCQRCGALLERAESPGDPVTATYRIDDAGELVPVEIGEVTQNGPALVIRAGRCSCARHPPRSSPPRARRRRGSRARGPFG